MGCAIVITSGKGGVGKTTTTANLGTALAALGKKVVVVDGDTGLRNLDVLKIKDIQIFVFYQQLKQRIKMILDLKICLS